MKKILIIGDDSTAMLLNAIMTRDRGRVETKICTKGRKAVDVAKCYKPRLIVICGITTIPGIWGFVLIKELRRRKCFNSAKILLCSVKEAYGLRAYNMGVNDYLPKPFDVREARERMLRLI